MEMLNTMDDNASLINSTLLEVSETEEGIVVSEELLQMFRLVNHVIITGPVSAIGIIFNVINIVVFIKLGFKDTVNISLLALAVSDLISIIPCLWMSISYNPLFAGKDGDMDFEAVQVIVGWLHVCFSRVTGCLTAFVTFERYLCVALPLKIKTIITPRRTVIIAVGIFILVIAFIAPEYFCFGLHPYFSPTTNLTLIGIVYNKNGRDIEHIVLFFAAFSPLITIFWIIITTIGLVRTLSQKSKWRNSSSSANESSALSSRERKTVKMIVSISIIFIASYLPLSVSLVGMLMFKEYSIQGKYNNLLVSFATFFFCLETINSSVNIFVYYTMSSKFKGMLLNLMRVIKKPNT